MASMLAAGHAIRSRFCLLLSPDSSLIEDRGMFKAFAMSRINASFARPFSGTARTVA